MDNQPLVPRVPLTPGRSPWYRRALILVSATLLCSLSCSSSDPVDGSGNGSPNGDSGEPQGTPRFTYRLLNVYPHDSKAFTQGLVFDNGVLYEGTGLSARSSLKGISSLRRVELETGEVLQQRLLDDRYFGEGIALVAGRIIQLTMSSNIGFLYDKDSFALQGNVTYETPGWGLTFDGNRLIMSDGTANLYFRDPATFELLSQVEVFVEGTPLHSINELEFVRGEVFANIWKTDLIARISPDTGEVLGLIDMSGLLTSREQTRVDVLNGIAYDAVGDRLFVTGKFYPWLFEIELVPQL